MANHGGGKKEPRECQMCGNQFHSLLTAERQNKRKKPYCSANCYHKAQRLGMARYKPATMIDYVCAYCEKNFTLKLALGKRFYCSRECFTLGRRKQQRKKVISRSYQAIRIRKKAHERIPCFICGFKRYVELCHIVPVAKGGRDDSDNMIFLCPNHHRLFDCHRLNKTELGKLGDKLMLIYNTGITQTQTFHYIP